MNISGVVYESLVDGLGIRTTIFISGCNHNCKGCQNPELQDFNNGKVFTVETQQEIIKQIKNNPLIQGITLSGGDPMFSAKELVDFINLLRSEIYNINIWCYTGFIYEEVRYSKNLDMIDLLKLCDVIVDGKFIEEQKNITLSFMGSKNQRIIDVQKSLKQGRVIELVID